MTNSVPQVDATNVSSVSEISSIRAKASQQRKLTPDLSATKPLQDSVKLSTASRVLAMKNRGVPVEQIAATLGLSVADINAAISTSASSATSPSSQSAIIAAYSAKS